MTPNPTLNRSNYYQVGIETMIVWIVGICCGLPVSVYQAVVTFPQYSDQYIQCIEDWPKTLKAAYSVSILIVQCVLPSVALVVTGQAITSHLNRVAGLLSLPGNVTCPMHRCNSTTATAATAAGSTTVIVAAPSDSETDCSQQEHHEMETTSVSVNQVSPNARTAIVTSSVPSSSTGGTGADYHQRNVERNQSVTRTLLAVSISFTVCWMPLHILNVLIDLGIMTHETYSEYIIYLMIAICSSIAMTSVPLNALLYGWYNPSINREVISWRSIANASLCYHNENNNSNPLADVTVSRAGNNNRDDNIPAGV